MARLGSKRKRRRSVRPASKIRAIARSKTHPWRLCPDGQHWVRSHDRSNAKHGVHGYCRHNPSEKDQIYELEMDEIAEKYFDSLKGSPAAKTLGYSQGNKFDVLIRGWTKYWNDVFSPVDQLDPDLVKALIATESSFRATNENPGNKRIGKARGLIQIAEETLRILKDEKGELKDHYVTLDQKDLFSANQNICAGVRWLFRKKETASAKLKRTATWIEAVADYKAYLRDYLKNPKHEQMQKLIAKYEELKK